MRADPPCVLPVWQRPAQCAASGGFVFDFNRGNGQIFGQSTRGFPARSGVLMTTLSWALRSGPFRAGPSFWHRQSLADGVGRRKFPFSNALDRVQSALIKTLTRGSQTWSRNTPLSHLSLPFRWLAVSRAAAMVAATAIPHRSTAQPCAPLAVQQPVRLLPVQPADRAPRARLSARLRAVVRASFRAPTTAIDLPAAAARRSLTADRQSTDHSRTGSFSHSGWRAHFICGARSGPALPEGRESRCSRKS